MQHSKIYDAIIANIVASENNQTLKRKFKTSRWSVERNARVKHTETHTHAHAEKEGASEMAFKWTNKPKWKDWKYTQRQIHICSHGGRRKKLWT